MSGVVVVAGVFPPGSVVTLIQVPDERVLRPEGHEIVEQRLADEAGNVGFDGLEVGGRFFVCGYVSGNYTLVRCRAVDAAAPDSELAQAPIQPTPQKSGTQEALVSDPPPAAPDVELGVGVPDGAPPPYVEPAPVPTGEIAVEHVSGPVEDQPAPVEPDAAPQEAGTVPSESAGTAEQAGSPSEQAAAAPAATDQPPSP